MVVIVLFFFVFFKGGCSKQWYQCVWMYYLGGIFCGKEFGVLCYSIEFGLVKGGIGGEFFVDGDFVNESQQFGEVFKEYEVVVGGDVMLLCVWLQVFYGFYGVQVVILELFGLVLVVFYWLLVELIGLVMVVLWFSNVFDLVCVDFSNRSDSFEMFKEECECYIGLM